jgi:hypothetical protein
MSAGQGVGLALPTALLLKNPLIGAPESGRMGALLQALAIALAG